MRLLSFMFLCSLGLVTPALAQNSSPTTTLDVSLTTGADIVAAQAENPLRFSRAYGSVAASFTLPEDVLLKQGRVIVLTPELKERKTQFLNALGSVDEAIQNITGEAPPSRDVFNLNDSLEPTQETDILADNPITLPPNSRQFPFIELRDYLQQGLIEAPDAATRAEIRTDLARLHITFDRYEEALSILSAFALKPQTNLPNNPDVQTLMGIAHALNGDAAQARRFLRTGEPDDKHRLLWLAYVTADAEDAQRLFERTHYLIPGYPPKHDEILTRQYARILLQTSARISEVIPLIEDLMARQDTPELTSDTLYLLYEAYAKMGDTNKAMQTLANVAESGENPTAYRAKYEFVTQLQRQGDLSNQDTIRALESLARLWRGDDLEQQILLDLGRLYLAEKEFRKALNYLKNYVSFFPDGQEREQVAYLMTQNFLSAFNETNALMTDDLGFLSLYYDFRELTPADKRGDKLIQQVAERLERLNLFDQAKNLFEQQLNFRVDNANDKADISLELARLHRKNNAPERSLELLKQLDTNGLNTRRQNDFLLEMARAHYALQNYAQSKTLLTNVGTDGARDLLIDIAWSERDSATLIKLITPIFQTNEHAGFETAAVRNHFIRLAYAHVFTKDTAAIEALRRSHADVIQDYPEMADAIAFAIARSGAEEVVASAARPVGRLASEIAKLNELINEYDVLSASVQERKMAREIFNQKMRYMEQRGGF